MGLNILISYVVAKNNSGKHLLYLHIWVKNITGTVPLKRYFKLGLPFNLMRQLLLRPRTITPPLTGVEMLPQ